MASMKISLPDPLRAYVQERIDSGRYASADDYMRDLIRRDQRDDANEKHWLDDLDASIAESVAEMKTGGGIDLDAAYHAALAEIDAATGSASRWGSSCRRAPPARRATAR